MKNSSRSCQSLMKNMTLKSNYSKGNFSTLALPTKKVEDGVIASKLLHSKKDHQLIRFGNATNQLRLLQDLLSNLNTSTRQKPPQTAGAFLDVGKTGEAAYSEAFLLSNSSTILSFEIVFLFFLVLWRRSSFFLYASTFVCWHRR